MATSATPQATTNTAAGGREVWLDVARGLGIVFVVAGHCYSATQGSAECPVESPVRQVIYWWHMPFFFMLSGYVFRPPTSWRALPDWAWRRSRRLLIPYVAFIALWTALRWSYLLATHQIDRSGLLHDAGAIILGGRPLGDVYSVMWFITCLAAAQLAIAVLFLALRSTPLRIAALAAAYLLAHATVSVTSQLPIPWSLDTAVLAVAYYGLGYYARPLLTYAGGRWFTPICGAATFAALAFAVTQLGGPYILNLKADVYTNAPLDFAVPAVFALVVIGVSRLLEATPVAATFALLGTESMAIMYLHIPINMAIHHFIDYGVLPFTLLGVLLSLAVTFAVLRRSAWLRWLFLGEGVRPALRWGHPKGAVGVP